MNFSSRGRQRASSPARRSLAVLFAAVGATVGAALPAQQQPDRFHFENAPRRYVGVPAGNHAQPGLFPVFDNQRNLLRVVRTVGSTSLNILRADGQGFAVATSTTLPIAGYLVEQLVRGDTDGDGVLDLLIAGMATSSPFTPLHQVLRGNATGGYTPQPQVALPWSQNFFVGCSAEDLDGDNRADFLVWNRMPSAIHLRLSTGAVQNLPLPAGSDLQGVVSVDLDGDGVRDVAALVRDANTGLGAVSVLRNQGGGVFPATGVSWPTGGDNPTGIAFGDVDGDGDFDLLTTVPDVALSRTSLAVLVNAGNATFAAPVLSRLVDADHTTVDIELVRLDDDARSDVVVSFASGTGSLVTARGVGNGAFTTTSVLSVPAGDVCYDPGRWRGERRLLTGSGHVVPVRRDGTIGTFGIDTGAGPFGPLQAVLDFDRDGRVDIATHDYAAREVRIHLADGEGGIRGTIQLADPLLAGGILHAGDIDGDGFVDLLLEAPTELHTLRNLAGAAIARITSPLSGAVGVCSLDYYDSALGDLNGDGRSDLVRTARRSAEAVIAVGTASGAMVPSCNPLSDWMGQLALGDLDGDGFGDAAMVNRSTGGLAVHRGTGVLPAFAVPQSYTFSRALSGGVTVADVDRDGDLDVVMSSNSGVVVATNGGTGVLAEAQYVELGRGPWEDLAVVDLDGDELPEIVLRDRVSKAFYRVLGNDGGSFVPSPLVWDFGSGSIDVADFDADGLTDVIVGAQQVDAGQLGPVVHFNRSELRGFGDAGAGRTIALDLQQPAAPGAIYLLLAGVDGTWPGLPLPGSVVLPLNPTAPLIDLVLGGGAGVFGNFLGLLDANGRATASFSLPPGFVVPAPLDVDFAFFSIELGSLSLRASNSWSVRVQ